MSAPKQVTVTITVDNHSHAGQPVAKGEQLVVDEATAAWLIDNKLASAAPAAADAAPKKEAK